MSKLAFTSAVLSGSFLKVQTKASNIDAEMKVVERELQRDRQKKDAPESSEDESNQQLAAMAAARRKIHFLKTRSGASSGISMDDSYVSPTTGWNQGKKPIE